MKHAPKDALHAWIVNVQQPANDCGCCSSLVISLFLLGKSITSLVEVDIRRSQMKAKYLLYVNNAAANAACLISERFDGSTPSASYANEPNPRQRTDCRPF